MRKYDFITIFSACLTVLGGAIFYTALLLGIVKFIFELQGRPPLFLVIPTYCLMVLLGFRFQFRALLKLLSGG